MVDDMKSHFINEEFTEKKKSFPHSLAIRDENHNEIPLFIRTAKNVVRTPTFCEVEEMRIIHRLLAEYKMVYFISNPGNSLATSYW